MATHVDTSHLNPGVVMLLYLTPMDSVDALMFFGETDIPCWAEVYLPMT
jgi:hypothetical protein